MIFFPFLPDNKYKICNIPAMRRYVCGDSERVGPRNFSNNFYKFAKTFIQKCYRNFFDADDFELGYSED